MYVGGKHTKWIILKTNLNISSINTYYRSLKKDKDYFLKRKMLSSEQVVIFLLAEGLVSVLMVADCSGWWLLNVGVAVAIS